MTTRANIEAAVYDWIYGATSATTVFANQARPRPATPFCTIKVGNVVSIGHDEDRSWTDPGAPDYPILTHRGDREVNISVQVFGAGAMDLARAAARALATETTRAQLATAGLCPRTIVPAVNELTALLETDFEGRAQFDATLALGEEYTDTVPVIETVETHGVWLAVDSASVLYPTATLAGAGSVTAALQYLLSGTATLTGVGSVAIDPLLRYRLRSATLAGAGGSVTAVGGLIRTRSVSATLAGAGALVAPYQRWRPAASTLAGAGSVTASMQYLREVTAALAGAGAASGTTISLEPLFVLEPGAVGHYRFAASAIAGAGAASAGDYTRTRRRTAALAGAGALSAGTTIRTRGRSATLAGAGAVTATASKMDALFVLE